MNLFKWITKLKSKFIYLNYLKTIKCIRLNIGKCSKSHISRYNNNNEIWNFTYNWFCFNYSIAKNLHKIKRKI